MAIFGRLTPPTIPPKPNDLLPFYYLIFIGVFIRRFRKIAKSDYQFCHVRPSGCQYATTPLPQKGFS
jgi:hypothetical protein